VSARFLVVSAMLSSSSSSLAHADPKQACLDAHVAAQKLRQSSKLRAAREQLEACRAPACPDLAREDCTRWLGEVDRELGSIVVTVSRAAGGRVDGATLTLDGAALAATLAPVPLEPGTHVVRADAPGARPVETTFVLQPGEKELRVSLVLPFDDATPGPVARPVPTATWVFGAVGLVAAGSFTAFALSGRAGQDELERCKPRCDAGDVDATRTKYLVANVSLGVSVVALAAGAYFFFTRGGAAPPRADGARVEADASGVRFVW
jgi:hypothetical protein